MWVYINSEPETPLFTVGFYKPDGKWVSDSDHGSREEAAKRTRFLNGGTSIEANAALIAAAPDLLAACKAVCEAASNIILLADKSTNAGSAMYGAASTLKRLVLSAIEKAEKGSES